MPESERIPLLASALGQIWVKGWSTGFCFNLHAAAREAAIPGSKQYQTHLSRHCIDMPTQQALQAVGMATMQLPHALRRRECGSAALSAQAGCPVTVASPHRGAHLARIAPERCVRIMHQGPRSHF